MKIKNMFRYNYTQNKINKHTSRSVKNYSCLRSVQKKNLPFLNLKPVIALKSHFKI